jgi:predicted ester cyclase
MSTDELKNVVRNWVDQVWNGGKLELADELMPASYVVHLGGPEPLTGPEGFKSVYHAYHSAFPDLRITIEDLVAEGEQVVWRWSATGTHQGLLFGVYPATGRSIKVGGMVISRFEGERWVEDYALVDGLTMLQQIGAVPTPG